ncbi:hypothetical protein AALH74_03610 [Lactobacillus johnsonii]|uniref:hypothetical protein n=1 Tax=Lactobacillus TaxID=1578 RepID=UPI001AEC59FE|nr:hypothetical protein [Lactobacillus taiwanensis]QTQ39467.1 hypothetical protein H1A07_06290 [Lactobacillus taiwanensis]
MKELEKYFEEIRSGKIKDYVVLGMAEDGETIIYINGRAPVCDGLISEAQIKATNHFENNLPKSELRNLLGDLS